ncbi:MAG TPA: glycosyltransferase, partial [Desulfomonilaceae bacterium]|nr:glycosyltransferase [Desulfomonilaceae bacterium]
EQKDGYTIFRSWSLRRHAHTCSVGEMGAFIVTNLLPALKHAVTWKPQVIHVHFAVPTGVLAWAVSNITGIPYVLSTQLGDVPGGVPDQTDHLFRVVKPLTKPIWKNAATVTVPSEHIRRMALSSYDTSIETVPNGIALDSIQQSPPEPHKPGRLVFAGRFNPQKNLIFLVRVLERISDSDWVMDILGDGPMRPQVVEEVRKAGLENRVHFHGWVEPGMVEDVMSRSDILFLPSLSEGLPVVGVRALAAGLAIVGSDVGGIDDCVNNGKNGFLCRVNDFEPFENALRTLLTSDECLTSMKQESRKFAEKFDIRTVVARFEKMFQAAALSKK